MTAKLDEWMGVKPGLKDCLAQSKTVFLKKKLFEKLYFNKKCCFS
jgi:hypothetical protein